jgi:hypothetical protein
MIYVQRKKNAVLKAEDFLEWVVESVFELDKENIFYIGYPDYYLCMRPAPYIFQLNKIVREECDTWVEVRFTCYLGNACVLICISTLGATDEFCKHVSRASPIECVAGDGVLMDKFIVSDDLSPMQVAEKVMEAGKELLNFLNK